MKPRYDSARTFCARPEHFRIGLLTPQLLKSNNFENFLTLKSYFEFCANLTIFASFLFVGHSDFVAISYTNVGSLDYFGYQTD